MNKFIPHDQQNNYFFSEKTFKEQPKGSGQKRGAKPQRAFEKVEKAFQEIAGLKV